MSLYTVNGDTFAADKDGAPLGGSPYASWTAAARAAEADRSPGDSVHYLAPTPTSAVAYTAVAAGPDDKVTVTTAAPPGNNDLVRMNGTLYVGTFKAYNVTAGTFDIISPDLGTEAGTFDHWASIVREDTNDAGVKQNILGPWSGTIQQPPPVFYDPMYYTKDGTIYGDVNVDGVGVTSFKCTPIGPPLLSSIFHNECNISMRDISWTDGFVPHMIQSAPSTFENMQFFGVDEPFVALLDYRTMYADAANGDFSLVRTNTIKDCKIHDSKNFCVFSAGGGHRFLNNQFIKALNGDGSSAAAFVFESLGHYSVWTDQTDGPIWSEAYDNQWIGNLFDITDGGLAAGFIRDFRQGYPGDIVNYDRPHVADGWLIAGNTFQCREKVAQCINLSAGRAEAYGQDPGVSRNHQIIGNTFEGALAPQTFANYPHTVTCAHIMLQASEDSEFDRGEISNVEISGNVFTNIKPAGAAKGPAIYLRTDKANSSIYGVDMIANDFSGSAWVPLNDATLNPPLIILDKYVNGCKYQMLGNYPSIDSNPVLSAYVRDLGSGNQAVGERAVPNTAVGPTYK